MERTQIKAVTALKKKTKKQKTNDHKWSAVTKWDECYAKMILFTSAWHLNEKKKKLPHDSRMPLRYICRCSRLTSQSVSTEPQTEQCWGQALKSRECKTTAFEKISFEQHQQGMYRYMVLSKTDCISLSEDFQYN